MGTQACYCLNTAAVELQYALVQLTRLVSPFQSQNVTPLSRHAACLLNVAQIFVHSSLLQ
jgi:hypothetical protein